LTDLRDVPVVVVVFTCNSCVVATEYEDRLLAFAGKYGVGTDGKDPRAVKLPAGHGKVALVAINVNKVKEDLPAAMKTRAEKKKYAFRYLFDETQKIARDYGALVTPQFFVLDRDRKVVYMGAMDDNSNAADVKRNYLEAAVEAALAGRKPETSETAPSGCRIRYARQRR
jgi:AhpC/TSA family protein